MLVGSLPLALPPEMTIRTSTDVDRGALLIVQSPIQKSKKLWARPDILHLGLKPASDLCLEAIGLVARVGRSFGRSPTG